MADSASVGDRDENSGSENPGEPLGSGEEFEEFFEENSDSSRNEVDISPSQTDTATTDSTVRYNQHMFDPIEGRQRLQKHEQDLKRVQEQLISQENVQVGLSTQVTTIEESVNALDNNINSLEEDISKINSELETFATQDDAYNIADEKINGRVVRPLFLLISLLTFVGAGSAFLTGPIVVGIVLATVTAVAWYLLYVTRP